MIINYFLVAVSAESSSLTNVKSKERHTIYDRPITRDSERDLGNFTASAFGRVIFQVS